MFLSPTAFLFRSIPITQSIPCLEQPLTWFWSFSIAFVFSRVWYEYCNHVFHVWFLSGSSSLWHRSITRLYLLLSVAHWIDISNLFIHSFRDAHLAWVQFLFVIFKLLWPSMSKCFCTHLFAFPLLFKLTMSKTGRLCSKCTFFNYLRNCKPFEWVSSSTLHVDSVGDLQLLYSLTNI